MRNFVVLIQAMILAFLLAHVSGCSTTNPVTPPNPIVINVSSNTVITVGTNGDITVVTNTPPTPVPVTVVTNAPPVPVPVPTPVPVVVNSNDSFTMTSYTGEGEAVFQFAPMKQTCDITSWTLTSNSIKIWWQDSWPVSGYNAGTMVWCWQDGSGAWQGHYVEWRGGSSPYTFVGPFSNTYIHQYKTGDKFGFLFVSLDHTQRSQTVMDFWQ